MLIERYPKQVPIAGQACTPHTHIYVCVCESLYWIFNRLYFSEYLHRKKKKRGVFSVLLFYDV